MSPHQRTKVIAFDDHGNWLDVSGGVTLMTVSEDDYQDAIEELLWKNPPLNHRKSLPISVAEQYDQDGEVHEITVLDYASQQDLVLKRVDLPY